MDGAAAKEGERCSNGYAHISEPSASDKKWGFFNSLEERYGEWAPGKFVYDAVAAPAEINLMNAGVTPPASPRSTPAASSRLTTASTSW